MTKECIVETNFIKSYRKSFLKYFVNTSQAHKLYFCIKMSIAYCRENILLNFFNG